MEFRHYHPQAKILADSLNQETGDRLVTFEIANFPKVLLQELNTHRMLSRNAASSRAIPVNKMIERVATHPYIPTFRENQRGMVGKVLSDREQFEQAVAIYQQALADAIHYAEQLSGMSIHKESVNRLLEPFMTVPVIISGTEWQNFFKLRTAPAATPDFQTVALLLEELYHTHQPTPLKAGEIHGIFSEFIPEELPVIDRLKVMSARAARISYKNHGSNVMDINKDLELAENLIKDGHLSPLEHVGWALNKQQCLWLDTRNYQGFLSFRAYLETSTVLNELLLKK
ncbi:MAG: FAD-dependent thymidylate synthase [Pseudanabaenaceae cyanobacterium]